jgi:wyosine [tRNA(Phe)-imidazoG37] synthetase (radical SAM superfamily)
MGLQTKAVGLSESSHPRRFRENRYVYPVLSRRSGGVSVGINLNPDKVCDFGCIYCQVDRRERSAGCSVDLKQVVKELRSVLLGLRPGGELWTAPEFASLPASRRHVADVAFSGDGEPTWFRNFAQAARAVVRTKDETGFTGAKVVLLTNGSGLRRPDVAAALRFLDKHSGEVWAKLEAGTAEYFHQIHRNAYPFEELLANILACGRARPVVIQSCFVRVRGKSPPAKEIAAYLDRLRELREGGAQIRFVQVYTIARAPAYGIVSSLTRAEVDRIARQVRAKTGLEARAYYGSVGEGQGLLGEEPPEWTGRAGERLESSSATRHALV